MLDQAFKQYDIRGIVGVDLKLNEVYKLGRALAAYLIEYNPNAKTVVVGMDGRVHSPFIKQELCHALRSAGLTIIFIGVVPTPVLYFALYNLQVEAGFMITASHNGPEYNGIKICFGKDSIWGEQLNKLRNFFKQSYTLLTKTRGLYEEKNMIEPYIAFISAQFLHLQNKTFALALSCMHGATSTVMPDLIKKMGWKNVRLLQTQLHGDFVQPQESDPSVEKNMMHVSSAIKNREVQWGLAFDGDGDRMAAIAEQNLLVSGDKLLALYSKQVLQKNPGSVIISDIKCSNTVINYIRQHGGVPVISQSGHAIIKSEMKKQKALLAGELSGHFSFADRYFGYDDGIYAAMRLIELVDSQNSTLMQLIEDIPQSYATKEIRLPISLDKQDLIVKAVYNSFCCNKNAKLMTIDGVRVTLPFGWALVRSSHTQPCISVRCESETIEGFNQIKKELYTLLLPFFEPSFLSQQLDLKLYDTCGTSFTLNEQSY